MNRKLVAGIAAAAFLLTGCVNGADIASQNISNDADNFKVDRRIVGINLITDKYLFMVEGKCSIKADTAQNQLEVTCKVGPEAYQKHFIGIPDGANVTYTIEQLTTTNASEFHYKLTFKPEVVVPTVVR